MSNLEDLYREVILDHYRSPRNKGELPPPATCTEGANPLCGDEIKIFLDVADGVVRDVRFSGHGCSISQASASMMTAIVKGKPLTDVRAVAKRFKQLMTIEEDDGTTPTDNRLGDIEALQGVVKYPVRIKCAVLGWNTLLEGLDSTST
ncbi:MAG: Fe-S cluster assembly sulfur transfer protein SufU [Ilumatobacteraceae bacterium]